MPWASNPELPDSVRGTLPPAAQTAFRRAANSALEQGASEQDAMRIGWGAVKQHWRRGASGMWVPKVETKTLYVSRPLQNGADLVTWAKRKGCKKVLDPAEMHVTIAHSKTPMEWPEPHTSVIENCGGGRRVKALGDSATVLTFQDARLQARWDYLRSLGASWSYDSYEPHVTISYDRENSFIAGTEPYEGSLIFGPELHEEVSDDWSEGVTEKMLWAEVQKVDSELGIVFGWAIVSTQKGRPYFDLQGDHIPDSTMLKAAAGFMSGSRAAGNMHRKIDGGGVERIGTMIFALPLTADVSKALGITCEKTGLVIGMKVDNPVVLEKFRNGEYTGFSIGGYRIADEEVT